EDGRVLVWAPAAGRPIKSWSDAGRYPLALSRDGLVAVASTAAAVRDRGEKKLGIFLSDLDGTTLQFLPAHTAELTDLAFSPDGMLLASASLDHTVRLWQIEDRKAKDIPTAILHADKAVKLACSADDRFLASIDAVV